MGRNDFRSMTGKDEGIDGTSRLAAALEYYLQPQYAYDYVTHKEKSLQRIDLSVWISVLWRSPRNDCSGFRKSKSQSEHIDEFSQMSTSCRELQNMTKAKSDGGEGLYVRGRSGIITRNLKVLSGMKIPESGMELMEDEVRFNTDERWGQDSGWTTTGMFFGIKTKLDISLGISLKRGFYREDAVGQDQAVDQEDIKGRKALGEYQIGGRSRRQNGLVEETNVTLLAKVCFTRYGFHESGKYKNNLLVLVSYREDSNEAAFAVAEAEKIYAHESLTFNNTVACEVISKWKAGLKDDMDARSDVYVLSNDYKKCSDDHAMFYYWAEIWATKGLLDKAKGNVLGMEIIRDQSGNTLRVSQSRFYNGKLVQTLLEGHSILSLEGSLSGDCDVEKNGKWSCIYAVGSQEYQMVCTRLDIASADVAMMLHMMALSPTEAEYMTLIEAAKEAIWIKGLAMESTFELKIVAGIAIGALSKAILGLRFQHRLNLLSIGIG
ncbi:hypothetical protein Tco_1504332 [Tanacetum coccineum]